MTASARSAQSRMARWVSTTSSASSSGTSSRSWPAKSGARRSVTLATMISICPSESRPSIHAVALAGRPWMRRARLRVWLAWVLVSCTWTRIQAVIDAEPSSAQVPEVSNAAVARVALAPSRWCSRRTSASASPVGGMTRFSMASARSSNICQPYTSSPSGAGKKSTFPGYFRLTSHAGTFHHTSRRPTSRVFEMTFTDGEWTRARRGARTSTSSSNGSSRARAALRMPGPSSCRSKAGRTISARHGPLRHRGSSDAGRCYRPGRPRAHRLLRGPSTGPGADESLSSAAR